MEVDDSTDQYGGQPPEVQLLGGQTMGLALGAVVELILSQLLFPGEGLQAAVQADGLGLGPAGLFHAAVLLHYLQGEQTVCQIKNPCISETGVLGRFAFRMS